MPRYRKKYSLKKKSAKKASYKRHSLKKGGVVLGKGSYGCIIKPNIPCINTQSTNNLISKLTNAKQFSKYNQTDDNTIISKLNIKNMEGYEKHLLLPIEMCNDFIINLIDTDIIQKSQDIDNCNLRGEAFVNIIQEYGGEQFDKFILKKDTLLEVLPYYCAIFEAIQFLNNNGIIHRDIKGNNIVVSHDSTSFINNDSLKIIDFGYAAPINNILFNKLGNSNLTKPIYIHNAMDQLLKGYFIWPTEYSIFYNFEKDSFNNVVAISDSVKNTYYNIYKKYWLKSGDENIYNNHYYQEIYILNDYINQINNIQNNKDKHDEITKLIYEINYKTDVFAFGVLLKIDLTRLLAVDKQNEILINELIEYILTNMLNINSFHRPNINDAYIQFKNICNSHNIDSSFLYNINEKLQPFTIQNAQSIPLFSGQNTQTNLPINIQTVNPSILKKDDLISPGIVDKTETVNEILQPTQIKRTYTFDNFF
jgi:serine/threonine protein kinase